MDPAEAAALAGLLVRTERKLERALGGLAGNVREQVLDRLVEVGKQSAGSGPGPDPGRR